MLLHWSIKAFLLIFGLIICDILSHDSTKLFLASDIDLILPL